MTSTPDNPDPTPRGERRPSEETMLAWIEGELSASEVAQLERDYPKAAFQVRLMRGDAGALRACAGEAAPSDLASRTIEALQREAMLRLVAAEAETPVAPVRMASPRETVLARVGGWRLALAAMLTLAVGAGVYVATTGGSPTTPNRGTTFGPLATTPVPGGDASKIAIASPAASADSADSTMRSSGTEAPSAEIPSDTIAMNRKESAGEATGGTGNVADAGVMESSLAATDRLLALAREGRLVMRVEGASRPLSIVEATAARDTSRTWRLSKDVPDSVLASLAPVVTSAGSHDSGEPSAVIVAAEHMPDQSLPIGPGAMKAPLRSITAGTPAPKATAYYAELSADGDTLDRVRTMFAAALRGEVEFEVLDTPVSIESPAGVDDVLWWTQSPANWSPRVTVPIVVTRR